MRIDLSNPLTQKLALTIITTSLNALKSVLPVTDVKEIGDMLLNKIEGLYPEGSWKDEVAEAITGVIRSATNIPDSDPNN